jgi:peptidoglycan/LPS O-acetylase OafA/YrhL
MLLHMATPKPIASVSHPVGKESLPESASLLLDIVRFSLAVLVVIGHVSQPPFSIGWPSLMAGADLGVPGFFVLSGFVIRYVTLTRERDAKRYWVNRISRMYSVVLPAIAVAFVCGFLVRRLDPAFWVAANGPGLWDHIGLRLFLGLTFLTQLWGHNVILLSDGPLWSLGYEVSYYVLFGVLMFTRGPKRWLWFAAVLLFYGPQIAYLLPLWWSGCWLYDLWQATRKSAKAGWVAAGCLAVVLALIFPWPLGGVLRIATLPNPLEVLHQFPGRATNLAWAGGLLAFTALYLALTLSDMISIRTGAAWERWVRRIAEGTFALYVLHRPLLVLAGALHLYRPDHTSDKVLLIFVLTVIGILASSPMDSLKNVLRRVLTGKPAKM